MVWVFFLLLFLLHLVRNLCPLILLYCTFCTVLGLYDQVLVVGGLQGWLLWEAARNLLPVQQSHSQLGQPYCHTPFLFPPEGTKPLQKQLFPRFLLQTLASFRKRCAREYQKTLEVSQIRKNPNSHSCMLLQSYKFFYIFKYFHLKISTHMTSKISLLWLSFY